MAIVIEEERSLTTGWVSIVGWLVILAIIAATAYYVFFARPELIPIDTPRTFEHTEQLSQIDLNPETIVSNPEFQKRIQHISAPPPASVGRTNPFSPF